MFDFGMPNKSDDEPKKNEIYNTFFNRNCSRIHVDDVLFIVDIFVRQLMSMELLWLLLLLLLFRMR